MEYSIGVAWAAVAKPKRAIEAIEARRVRIFGYLEEAEE
jgi:hypothetical protein